MLVERVTGTTLQNFTRKEFFEPRHYLHPMARRLPPHRAQSRHRLRSTRCHLASDMPFEDVYGNGGLLTTVGDLLKWNANLASGDLHASIFRQMQKPSTLANGRSIGYGFGLFLEDFQSIAEVSHSGATAAYRAWLGRLPSKNLSVAILCNAASANPTDFASRIMRLYVGGAADPKLPGSPQGSKSGLYRSVRDHATVKVEQTQERLPSTAIPSQPA